MISQVTKGLASEARVIFRHRLATSTVLLALGRYTAAVLNLTTNVVMARLLGPTDYGLVALTVAYPTLLFSFVSVKPLSVTTRYAAGFHVKGEHEKLKAVVKLGYGIDFLVSFLAFILVASTGWWVSHHFYKQPNLAWLMAVYAGSFPLFSLTGTSLAVLFSWEHFRTLAIVEVLHAFLKLILITVFLFSGFGVAGAVVGTALAQAIIGLMMMLVATYLFLYKGVGPWWVASFQEVDPIRREITGFFGWNYLLVTLSGLVGQIPVMLLGRFRNPEEVGFYRLTTSVVMVGSYLETAMGRVAYPILAKRWQEEKERITISLRRWTLRGGLPAALILFGTIPILPLVVPLVFGKAYQPAVVGIQIMMVASAVSAAFFWLVSFYFSAGFVKHYVLGYLAYVGLALGISWLVVPQWGFLGVVSIMAIGKALFTLGMLALKARCKP